MSMVIYMFVPIKSCWDIPNFLTMEKDITFRKTPLSMKTQLIGLPFITAFTYNDFKCHAQSTWGFYSLAIPFLALGSSTKLGHQLILIDKFHKENVNNCNRNIGII
ncbi:hypothetical protein AAZX31_15G255200 [Glycine max]